ncbi:MAG: hypothetical protein ACTHKA_04880 [Anaerocolumna jejuensis]
MKIKKKEGAVSKLISTLVLRQLPFYLKFKNADSEESAKMV